MHLKKAFTLIELLVVIAIIAILAAILFPVFAQAKVAAQKTADLSNQKQFATATLMYAADYDDTYFTQGGVRCNGAHSFNSRVLVPADWSFNANASACNNRKNGALGLPNNLIQPYVKNQDMMRLPGVQEDSPETDVVTLDPRDGRRTIVGYNFNGLLGAVSTTSVASPSTTPTWWSGFGKTNRNGNTYSHPYLICPDPGAPCTFNGGGPQVVTDPLACPYEDDTNNAPGRFPNGSRSGVGSGVFRTVWIYGRGMNWAFSDGHAKWRTLGSRDPRTDPFSAYGPDGTPVNNAARKDTQCHVLLFRPDYQP